jgi:hypothetical protein
MTNLANEAMRLVFRLDELLEPLEDCSVCPDIERYRKLRKALNHAGVRYYRRRQIDKPSPYSLMAAILEKVTVSTLAQVPELLPELTYELDEDRPVQWFLPKVNPTIVPPYFP